jgi:hypothetical protein
MNIYIVKSGQLIDFVGWEWLNLKAFTDYDQAKEFSDTVEQQLKNLDTEGVEIEQLTLEG